MADEIEVISEEEYNRLAQEAEAAMYQDAPPDAGLKALKSIREETWARNLCSHSEQTYDADGNPVP